MKKRTSFSKLMKPQHLSATRMLGYVLTLETPDAWWSLAQVLATRLTVQERGSLAFMALMSLERDDALMTAEAALCQGAGQPQAPLLDYMDQAAFWADMAEPDELAAYCLASFNAMPRGMRSAFLDHVQGRQAA